MLLVHSIHKMAKTMIKVLFLELRFGKAPPEIVEKINQTDDPEILKNFLKQGVQVKTLDQLQFSL